MSNGVNNGLIEAPWFEDFSVGDDFSAVPAVTVTDGYGVIHQALFADRSYLPLNKVLCEQVTGRSEGLVNAALVCNLAIGQTTIPSQRVMGNLFYRGLVLRQPVFVGDTLSTETRVVALRQNTIKPGRAASGMVALEMHVKNQRGDTVLLFWRCPMVPCKDKSADTGHADDFSVMPEEILLEDLKQVVPDWDYGAFKSQVKGLCAADLEVGQILLIEPRDTVTLAPELVRMTLNLAMTHTDAERSVYGKRLVYGGHTISMAAAQLSRILPGLVTILAWYKCDHLAPVFEEDILQTEVTVEAIHPLDKVSIVDLHIKTFATRGGEAPEPAENVPVLDWHLAALVV